MGKEELKSPLFVYDKILYVENPKNSKIVLTQVKLIHSVKL